jgi:hypothetical protein
MIDTSSPWGEMLFNLLSTFAQFERGLIRERVKAGLRRAKAQGRHIGRPAVLNGNLDMLLPQILAGRMSRREAARLLKVNVSTVSRAVLQKTRQNGVSETLTNAALLSRRSGVAEGFDLATSEERSLGWWHEAEGRVSKTIQATTLLLLAALCVYTALVTRYQYVGYGQIRIDRWTGIRQIRSCEEQAVGDPASGLDDTDLQLVEPEIVERTLGEAAGTADAVRALQNARTPEERRQILLRLERGPGPLLDATQLSRVNAECTSRGLWPVDNEGRRLDTTCSWKNS